MKVNQTQLEKAIELIAEVNYDCKEVKYSLDDVRLLREAIEILEKEKQSIAECCT